MKTFSKKITSSVLATAFVAVSLLAAPAAHAQSAVNLSGAAKDCDSNAVMYCGASTVNELQTKYNGNASIAQIYNHFGISSAAVKGMDATAAAGSVTKSGTVLVGNTVVATNALTAGRENISGSTKVTQGGVTFYTRKPSVSFRSSSLPAFVVMKDGVFQFAILAACGNPVSATPKTTPKTPEKPVTPTTPETPKTPDTPTTTTVSSVSTPTPEALPNTGPGEVIAVAVGASILGSAAYYIVSKRRFSL